MQTDAVRRQYETFPYPERDPEEEKERLLSTWPEYLAQINHYCFGGREDFRRGFRVLVAGGGTGDATLFLAEQLRDTDAQIVYLDASEASLAIARRRTEIRKLGNVQFVHASLLDLPGLGLGPFRYINCTGVLHHLPDPEQGLDSLLSVLDPQGALNILLYGRQGRSVIYHLQDLMRLACPGGADMRRKLECARLVLESLPANHPWMRHPLRRDPKSETDAEIYDMFLHARDRAYSVPELYEWFGRAGLHLQFSRLNIGPAGYRPRSYLGNPSLVDSISALPPEKQAAVAELAAGDMDLHCFFATRSPQPAAHIGQPDNVPFFYGGFEMNRAPDLAAVIASHPGQTIELRDARSGIAGSLVPGKYTRELLEQMDGEQSLGEMFARARAANPALAAVSDRGFIDDFRPVFEVFSAVDGMLLRHRSVPRFPTSSEQAELAFRWQQGPEDLPQRLAGAWRPGPS